MRAPPARAANNRAMSSNPLVRVSAELAPLVTLAGSERFPGQLAAAFATLVGADNLVALLYHDNQAPQLLYNSSSHHGPASQIDRFVAAAYLLDPVYRAASDSGRRGYYHLQKLAPKGFESTAYYKNYFKQTAISDEAGYLVSISPRAFVNLSLSRLGQSARLSRAELNLLQAVEPWVEALVTLHWREYKRRSPERKKTTLTWQLDTALSEFGSSLLTSREGQVIRLLLQGHAGKSIAERLGISLETVKLHRKKSYSKLQVGSQAELFHLFIDALSGRSNYRGGDPLKGRQLR